MTKCPACKATGYKKKKFTEDAFDLCGIKGSSLTYYVHNCSKCGHSNIDIKSLEKSRKELIQIIVSCETSAITRTTLSYLLKHLFEDSLFVMATETGLPAKFIKDVIHARRPLNDETIQRILEASFIKLSPLRNVKFVIED